jgi:type VI secretion system secreted protein Hcp
MLRIRHHYKEGLHLVRQAGGKGATVQQDYFRIYLKDALVTSLQLSGSNENPTESITFAFQAVEVAYKAEKDDGTLDAAVPKGYDLETLNYACAAIRFHIATLS